MDLIIAGFALGLGLCFEGFLGFIYIASSLVLVWADYKRGVLTNGSNT